PRQEKDDFCFLRPLPGCPWLHCRPLCADGNLPAHSSKRRVSSMEREACRSCQGSPEQSLFLIHATDDFASFLLWTNLQWSTILSEFKLRSEMKKDEKFPAVCIRAFSVALRLLSVTTCYSPHHRRSSERRSRGSLRNRDIWSLRNR